MHRARDLPERVRPKIAAAEMAELMQQHEPALRMRPVRGLVGQQHGAAEKSRRARNESRPGKMQPHISAHPERAAAFGEQLPPRAALDRARLPYEPCDCKCPGERAHEEQCGDDRKNPHQPRRDPAARRSGPLRDDFRSLHFQRRQRTHEPDAERDEHREGNDRHDLHHAPEPHAQTRRAQHHARRRRTCDYDAAEKPVVKCREIHLRFF